MVTDVSMNTADIVFSGGPIITVDNLHPRVEAVAVKHGKILAVGTKEQIDALRGSNTEDVDLAGRTLLPGFVEAHTHPTQEQLLFTEAVIDIRPVTVVGATGVMDAIRHSLESPPAERPMVFMGLDPLLQRGFPLPTREWLDEIGGSRPIGIMHNSGHLAWGNTAMLRHAGLGDSTPDPAGGRFGRNFDGTLTGAAYETPAILALIGDTMTSAVSDTGPLERQHAHLASRGITTCSDMGFSNQVRPVVQQLYEAGNAHVRMRVYEMSNSSGEATVDIVNGDDMFRQVGIKLWVDGSPWVGNIATSFPYLTNDVTASIGLGPAHVGHANYTSEQLQDTMDRYFAAGWQMACHAHGDVAVDQILDVYEDALRKRPRVDHRLRLEHCGAMKPAQFQRAANMGVTCSLFIDHLYYWGDVLVDDLFGEEHGGNWMRARSAIDAGVRISFHNDAPVTPEEPLRNIAVSATRRSRSGRQLGVHERIGVGQALLAQTMWPAYQLFVDHLIGSITPGKYADLVILNGDFAAIEPERLPEIAVEATYLAGRQTYPL